MVKVEFEDGHILITNESGEVIKLTYDEVDELHEVLSDYYAMCGAI